MGTRELSVNKWRSSEGLRGYPASSGVVCRDAPVSGGRCLLDGDPHLPSKACEFSSVLTGRAYKACGQATSSLHAMALLQFYQTKALMDMHEGSPERALIGELCTATDLALQGTSIAVCTIGLAMSTLVVQERHLWLNLVDMSDADKVRFLDYPISQDGLFGDAVEICAKQFSAAQLQTEAIRHIPPRDGGDELFRWLPFPELSKKEQIPLFLGPKRARLAVYDLVKPCTPQPPRVASLQLGAVRGPDYAFSRTPCRPLETGRCCIAHSDPASGRSWAFQAGFLSSTLLHHNFSEAPGAYGSRSRNRTASSI
ncbi:hypothetical protein PO909_001180 [Leuciscus waleckii]